MRLGSEELGLNLKPSTYQWGLFKEGLKLSGTQLPPWVIAVLVLSHRITIRVDYETVPKPHMTLKCKHYYVISKIIVMRFQCENALQEHFRKHIKNQKKEKQG